MSSQNLPKVSIVSITYNHAKYIKQALDSFLAQKTEFKFEIIVADDASSDDTQKIIQQYAEKHPDVIKPILRKQNIGIQLNCIEAFQKAKGDYIAFCEGDDYWTAFDKLQKQVDMMDADRDMSLCFHPVKIVFEDSHQKSYDYPEANPELTIEKLLKQNFIQSNSVVYRRQKYDSLPDDIMPLDWYLHLYHAKFGKIGFINRTMSVYRRHPGGVWWESDKDRKKFWIRFGAAHLKFYRVLSEMFPGNTEYKKIIGNNAVNALNEIRQVDKDLYISSLGQHPDFAEAYAEALAERIDKLEKHAQEQEKLIDKLQIELELSKNEVELLHSALSKTISHRLKKQVRRIIK